MNTKYLLGVGLLASVIAGCNSGDVNIAPSNVSTGGGNNDNDDSGSNICASYTTDGGQVVSGIEDGSDCRYPESFVGAGNNLVYDLTIPNLPNGGVHRFEGSLFVGEAYDNDADMTADGISEGGDGPRLTIEAGATLAFESQQQFVTINRGAQIFAVGTEDEPITFTSYSDVDGTVGPEDVQQWGGVVINGFGITNKCAYTGSMAGGDLALDGECHVASEGSAGLDASYYGGDNNEDSSGRLEYVIVKHTGAQVANGDELNGITFSGVGSNTVVNNLQVYSTYDDGIEMFGGAVDFENFVAVYVRDDSIDIDEGWQGSITNALVIQSETDGHHCIESDGIGSFDDLTDTEVENIISQGINSRPTISNLTCIISANGTGTHDPGAGWRFREGIFPTINDSLLVGSFAANDTGSGNDNYCLRIDNRTQQAAQDGDVTLNNVIYACAEATRGQTFPDGTTTERSFAEDQGNIFATIPDGTAVSATAANDSELQLLEGAEPVYSIDYATSQVDGAAPAASSDPAPRAYLGALSQGETDWTRPWAYGIDPNNRAQALWFENL